VKTSLDESSGDSLEIEEEEELRKKEKKKANYISRLFNHLEHNINVTSAGYF